MTSTESAPALWTMLDAARATDGYAAGHWSATGVSIDSRSVRPGDLFVALAGEQFDGHDFAVEALDRGAAAVVVHRPPPAVPAAAPMLVVDDTADALNDLARFARLRSRAKVVAVTGSVGKTGTKEALRLALEEQASTYASAGNLNNHWGVPLSLARLPETAAYAVFELGMNHAGEIEPLSRRVRPDVAIITNVEPVHIEFFDGVEGIADAKAEIFAGMNAAGTAILNRDSLYYPRLLAHARTQGLERIWSFGTSSDADGMLSEVSLLATCSGVGAVIRGEPVQYTLSMPGQHWVVNSLAVLLAVRAVGGDVALAARAMSRLAPLRGRGQRSRVFVTRNAEYGAFLLIDESYNASPVSMKAALSVLGAADLGDSGRRIAVLGDMLELGPDAAKFHAALQGDVLDAEVDLVFACGPNMARLYDMIPPAKRAGYAADSRSLAGLVSRTVRPGDAVMVKGSLGSRMAHIVDVLQSLDEDAGQAVRFGRAGRAAAAG